MVATPGARARSSRVGIALSPTALCAYDARLRGGGGVWRVALEPAPNGGAAWPALVDALRQLATALNSFGGELAVALMPPLTELRQIELPPLDDDSLQRLLSRNAARYFMGARSAQVIGAVRPPSRRGTAAPPVIAAAASARLVTSIEQAARDAGWKVTTIVPAEGAWAAAAVSAWPATSRGTSQVLVLHDDRTDCLSLEDGVLAGVRRFRPGGADATQIAELVGAGASPRTSARVGVLGRSAARGELLRDLAALGVSVSPAAREQNAGGDEPETIAAANITAAAGPVLLSDAVCVTRQETTTRQIRLIAAAAAVLALAAAGIEYLGVQRELAAVTAERATLKPQLGVTLVGRTSVETAYRRLAEFAEIERSTPHWSSAIASLGTHLPMDSYLSTIRGRGDTLWVDGLAARASLVYGALERTPGLTSVRSLGQMRREIQEGGDALDHFSFAAQLSWTGKPRVVPAKGAK